MHLRAEKPEDKTALAILIAKVYGAAGADVLRIVSSLRDSEHYTADMALICGDEHPEAFALFTPLNLDGCAYLTPLACSEKIDIPLFLDSCMHYLKSHGITHIFLHGQAEEMQVFSFKKATHFKDNATQIPDVELLVRTQENQALSGEIILPEVLK